MTNDPVDTEYSNLGAEIKKHPKEGVFRRC